MTNKITTCGGIIAALTLLAVASLCAETWTLDTLATEPLRQTKPALLPTSPLWELNAAVQPRRFESGGGAGIRFTDAQGDGFQVEIKPRNGGVMLARLVRGKVDRDAHIDRNPTMNLADRGYSFRLPFRLRVLVGDDRVQLYLGFHDLPADLIHAELVMPLPETFAEATVYCAKGDLRMDNVRVTARNAPPPDLWQRPAIREAMPTWAEFVGSHYIARDAIKLYRGLFYDPVIYRVLADGAEKPVDHRPWVAYVTKENLPPECEPRVGPYSGETVWLKQSRINEIVAWAEEHDAFMLHGRDVMKRTEYLEAAETMLRKDELYWSVRGFCEQRAADALPLIFHLGNEVNAFHLPWKNHPHVVDMVVEYNLAPSIEAIRRASADVYSDAEALPVMLGSITSPWPLGHGFLNAMVNRTIAGDMAPSLAGRPVHEFGDFASIHYSMKGPFWSHYLDAVNDRLVRTGKVEGFWNTEEVGGNADLHRGPYMMALPFRYLDWWSRRDWAPGRGGVIYWGDTRSREAYTVAMDVQELLGGFLGRHALVNLTDDTTVTGSDDVEHYAFTTRDTDEIAAVVGVMSTQYWFFPHNPASGTLEIKSVNVGRPEWVGRDDLRMVWLRVRDDNIERVFAGPAQVDAHGRVSWRRNVELDRSEEEVLIGFVTNRGAAFDPVFNFKMPEREASRWIDDREVVSFHLGNDVAADLADKSAWTMQSNGGLPGQSAAATQVNLDTRMAGDHHGLTVDRRVGQQLTHRLTLGDFKEHGVARRIEFSITGDPVDIWWDGELLAQAVSAGNPVVPVPPALANKFNAGEHRIELRNGERKTTTIDALAIERTQP